MNMKLISLLLGLSLMTFPDPAPSEPNLSGELVLTDFTSTSSDLGWYVVNDNVMGGRSEGRFELRQGEQEQGQLSFTGRTNTNGGGFSSIRTKTLQLDLSTFSGIRLHVKGDGRRYTWRLTSTARWRGRQVSYWAEFETRNGTWSTANIPFSEFVPRVRGNQLDGPPLDSGQITGMGLMIYDKQDGPFELRLGSVSVYAADSTADAPERKD
ncbi:MAG: CIA30 family protein [Gammaproteobacteria bacterium]|nr:CIA30 family protein [Gammaproteobacteria bacterium]